MNQTKLTAIGRAGHAIVAHLHRHPVKAIELDKPLELSAPIAATRAGLEDHIRVALAAPAAEMHYASLPTTHLSDDRAEVLHAIGLAEKIDPRRPIDVLEDQLDHTLACLRSPRVWHAVKYLGGALLRCPRGEMDGARVERVIREGLADLAGADFSKPAQPRRIYVDRGEPRR
jgi:hypothetical protein